MRLLVSKYKVRCSERLGTGSQNLVGWFKSIPHLFFNGKLAQLVELWILDPSNTGENLLGRVRAPHFPLLKFNSGLLQHELKERLQRVFVELFGLQNSCSSFEENARVGGSIPL